MYSPGEEYDQSTDSSTDTECVSHLGDTLTREFVDRVSEIITRHLGYEPMSKESQGEKTTSRLSSSNPVPPTEDAVYMPVDSSCKERFESVASRKRLKPFPNKRNLFRFQEKEVKELFTSPTLSEETSNKVRAESHYSRAG